MSSFARDFRYALRTLGRSPLFTLMAAFALALGANTAIFSVVNGVVLRGLPYRDADHSSYGLWQRVFGGEPGILGETIRLDDEPYTVTLRFQKHRAAFLISFFG